MGVYQQGQPIEITDSFFVDGVATDPTTVTYTILGPDGTVTIYTNADPEVANPDVGEFILSLSPPTFPGTYYYDVDATGAVVTSRSGSFSVLPNVSSVQSPTAWAVPGPCTSWTDAQDVWNCCGQPTETIGEGTMATECPVDMSQYAMEASQLLFELSGRIYSGHCSRTVVACEDCCGCASQVLSRGYVVWPSGWDSGCWPCGCQSRIRLAGYPVREVTEVVVDGVTLDPTAYRLDERRFLTRVDGSPWPNCFGIECSNTEAENTVSYEYGMDPPLVGVHAASELACELYKACSGQACALPSGVTRVSRQGVVLERAALTRWALSAEGWKTGLTLVDTFLSAYNPGGLRRRPTVWSPTRQLRYSRPTA